MGVLDWLLRMRVSSGRDLPIAIYLDLTVITDNEICSISAWLVFADLLVIEY